MAEKTLQMKRIFVQAVYNNLRNIPPKDYPTTAEIKTTIKEILPALEVHVAEYTKIFGEARDMNAQLVDKKITQEEVDKQVAGFNKRIVDYTRVEGQELVDVKLTEDGLKTLTEQFNREDWGKKWLQNIEEFIEVITAFEEAAK